MPAMVMAFREDSPSVGLMVPKLSVFRVKGRAPALIFCASSVAVAAVKESLVMVHSPSVMADSTVG